MGEFYSCARGNYMCGRWPDRKRERKSSETETTTRPGLTGSLLARSVAMIHPKRGNVFFSKILPQFTNTRPNDCFQRTFLSPQHNHDIHFDAQTSKNVTHISKMFQVFRTSTVVSSHSQHPMLPMSPKQLTLLALTMMVATCFFWLFFHHSVVVVPWARGCSHPLEQRHLLLWLSETKFLLHKMQRLILPWLLKFGHSSFCWLVQQRWSSHHPLPCFSVSNWFSILCPSQSEESLNGCNPHTVGQPTVNTRQQWISFHAFPPFWPKSNIEMIQSMHWIFKSHNKLLTNLALLFHCLHMTCISKWEIHWKCIGLLFAVVWGFHLLDGTTDSKHLYDIITCVAGLEDDIPSEENSTPLHPKSICVLWVCEQTFFKDAESGWGCIMEANHDCMVWGTTTSTCFDAESFKARAHCQTHVTEGRCQTKAVEINHNISKWRMVLKGSKTLECQPGWTQNRLAR